MASKLPAIKVRLDWGDHTQLKELAALAGVSVSKLVALMIRRTLTGQWQPAATFERQAIDDVILPRIAPPQDEIDPLML